MLAPAPAAAEGEIDVFRRRVDVAVATRLVRVLDERNCVATRVVAGDVRLLAGRRELPSRLRRRDGPIRVVLLVDVSFSMVGTRLTIAQSAVRRLVETLARLGAGSEVAVAAFDERVHWLTEDGFTHDLCAAAERVPLPEADGATALWASLDAALDLVEDRPSARPTAILVVTDGQDTEDRSGTVAARFERRALALDLPLFAIAIPPMHDVVIADEEGPAGDDVRCRRPEWMPRWMDGRRERLLDVCIRTGGALYTPRHQRVREAVAFVLNELRHVHEIEAEIPADLASQRDLDLRVAASRPGMSVLAGVSRPAQRR